MPSSRQAPSFHATAVAINGAGVLLFGPSGAGKSDLALRLIDRGAVLIADDRVVGQVVGEQLLLSAPIAIQGLIEVRGVGLVSFPFTARAPAHLAVQLAPSVARLPLPEFQDVAGHRLPLLRLAPFEASAPLKVELAVAQGLPNG